MKLTFPSIMYSTKFLGGLCFCLRRGGKFGDVNSLLQLFICEGRVFSGPARVNPFGPTQISNFTIVCAWPYGSCDNIGLFQTC